ncbi:MAG: UxaA family hydrolase [Peptococcaceae bacterium]|jgi:altronate dehydratase large subunit|nr:UxaA family hydrolase [Peptococcaceae bacterium]MDH7525011.1 UxaA family hydrolase [Peptococcaceae bacterium]
MDFYGYPRLDGQVGARNMVALIPTVGCVNAVALHIERLIRGTRAFTHHQGCLHPPQDTEQVTRTLINLGKNPNVAAALVLGLGCEMVKLEEVVEGIRESKKPVEAVTVHELGGMLETINKGAQIAADLVLEASRIKREKFGLDKLCFCTKCGSSDTTSGLSSNLVVGEVCRLMTDNGGTFIQGEVCDIMGGEYALKDLCVDPSQGDKIIGFVKDLYERGVAVGADVRGSQMTAGNVAGGLTTLIEKALGANAKGQRVPIQSALLYGERPRCPGRHIMATPGHGFENLTGGAAGGAQLILFTTGRGAPNGHPVIPTIKICGNKKTNITMKSHIDIDVSSVIEETESVAQAGERLYELAVEVASGRLTKAEILNYDGQMEILIKGPVM